EARGVADAELRGEAEAEEVTTRQCHRDGGALEQVPEPGTDLEPRRPRPAERMPTQERDGGDGDRDDRVRGETPCERDDPVPVRERREHHEADHASEREAGGGGAVAVERGE